MLKILSAEYLHDYKILVHFNNEMNTIFDFYPLIKHFPVFKDLGNKEVLKNFSITDTLEWENGNLDIAPEYILEHGEACNIVTTRKEGRLTCVYDAATPSSAVSSVRGDQPVEQHGAYSCS